MLLCSQITSVERLIVVTCTLLHYVLLGIFICIYIYIYISHIHGYLNIIHLKKVETKLH